MEFDGEIIKFNIFDAMRFPADVNYLCAFDVIDELSQDVYELSHEDELLIVFTQCWISLCVKMCLTILIIS